MVLLDCIEYLYPFFFSIVYKCYYNFAKRENIYKSDEILGRLVENKLYFTHDHR